MDCSDKVREYTDRRAKETEEIMKKRKEDRAARKAKEAEDREKERQEIADLTVFLLAPLHFLFFCP